MPKLDSQPVRISRALLEQLRPYAMRAGRSLPAEIEHRLKQSVELADKLEEMPADRMAQLLEALRSK